VEPSSHVVQFWHVFASYHLRLRRAQHLCWLVVATQCCTFFRLFCDLDPAFRLPGLTKQHAVSFGAHLDWSSVQV
jgi:hypothetical protein